MNQDMTWSATRNAASGMDASDSDSDSSYGLCAEFQGGDYRIYRCFFRFDLSAIPAGAEIISTYFWMSTYLNAASAAGCQRGTQGLSIDMDNFNSFTGAFFGSGIWHAYNPAKPKENSINFNAAGLAYIESRFGYTAKICAREWTKDCLNVAPVEPDGEIRNGLFFSEEAWNSRKPQLEITYKI